MKKHVALTLLAVTTLGVLNAHVDLPEIDGRRFVKVQEKLHDPIGWLEDRADSLLARCTQVHALGPALPDAELALAAIRSFSPPDSHSAQLRQLLAQGDWLLAEVSFDALSPAVVALRRQAGGMQVVDGAIWSGSTLPWRPAPLIRRHLQTQAPQMPQALLECFRPEDPLFQAR